MVCLQSQSLPTDPDFRYSSLIIIKNIFFFPFKVYQATPLIHRAVTSYTIEELKPDSQYEVGIFFIPFPGQTTELQSQTTVKLSTPVENGKNNFSIIIKFVELVCFKDRMSWPRYFSRNVFKNLFFEFDSYSKLFIESERFNFLNYNYFLKVVCGYSLL